MPPPETTVNQLTLEHWALIANVYNNWPFKSDVSLTVMILGAPFADPLAAPLRSCSTRPNLPSTTRITPFLPFSPLL
jgi:hypothetical protein